MQRTRIGILQFPGSNCDSDCIKIFKIHFGIELETIWHTQKMLPKLDGLILPGGFSFGDYLRGGALAAHLPVMTSVKEFANKGGAILGICNGFQILTEARILPGVLLKNASGKFICKSIELNFSRGDSVYHKTLGGLRLKIPIAHGEGRYYIDDRDMQKLKDRGGIVCSYADENPNGSLSQIAGVVSPNGRVFGLMPHPERATNPLIGHSSDGLKVIEAFLASFL